MFSDSCSFLHDVRVKVKQPEIEIISPTPDVTISFTQSSPVAASTPPSSKLDVRSPPRSPRLSSLLLALGDAIELDEEIVEEDEEDIRGPFGSVGAVVSQESSSQESFVPATSLAYLDNELEPYADGDAGAPEPLGSAPEDTEYVAVEGFAATPQSATANSDAYHDPDALLSPIEVRLAPPFFMPLGQLQGPVHRDDSMDSGYADGWTGPSPFSLSPPRNESSRRYSTLSLISSPFGSPARGLSPKFGPSSGSAWPTSPIFSPIKPKSSSRPTSLRLSQTSDDLDSPTDYHRKLLDSPLHEVPATQVDEDATIRRPIATALQDDSRQPSLPYHAIPADRSPTTTTPLPDNDLVTQAPINQDQPCVDVAPILVPVPTIDEQAEEGETISLYDNYRVKERRPHSPQSPELQTDVTSRPLVTTLEDESQDSSLPSSAIHANGSPRTTPTPANGIPTQVSVDQGQSHASVIPTTVPVHIVDEQAEEGDSISLYDSYYVKESLPLPQQSPKLQADITLPPNESPRPLLPSPPGVHRSSPSYASSSHLSSPPELVAGSSKDAQSPEYGLNRERRPSSRTTSPKGSLASPLSRPVRPPSSLSRQSSISEISGRVSVQSQKSTKVPFGFRHTIAVSGEYK